MKRAAAVFLAFLLLFFSVPPSLAEAVLDGADRICTVRFGADTYLFAYGFTLYGQPPAPEKSGLTFSGWYSGGEKLTLPYTVTEDKDFLAGYTRFFDSPAYMDIGLTFTGEAGSLTGTAPAEIGDALLEAYLFPECLWAEVTLKGIESARLYTLDRDGQVAQDMGTVYEGMTVTLANAAGCALARETDGRLTYVFDETQTVTLEALLDVLGIRLTDNNYNRVTADSELVALEQLKKKIQGNRVRDHRITALGCFDSAVLRLTGVHQDVVEIELKNPARTAGASLEGTDVTLSGALPENASVTLTPAASDGDSLFAFDITIDGGWEPAGPVTVTLTDERIGQALSEGRSVRIVHTLDDGTQEILTPEADGSTVTFSTDRFSSFSFEAVWDLVDWVFEKLWQLAERTLTTAIGTMDISLQGRMPRNATASAVEEAPGIDGGTVLCAAEITLYNGGNKVQPKNWNGALTVTMTSAEIAQALENGRTLAVCHIDGDGNETWLEDFTVSQDGSVTFSADSFSVYAVVDSGETADLNGQTFTIINTYTNNAIQDTSFTSGNSTRLKAAKVTIMDKTSGQYIYADEDLASWTFTSAGDGTYYIQSSDGQYMNIADSTVTVSSTPQALSVTAGTGSRAGQIRIRSGSSAVNNYGGATAQGFCTYNDNGNNEWFTLFETTDVILHPAYAGEKISVQDVEDAQQIILYKTVYNEVSGEYEDYAIDGNGNLIPVFDKGSQVTMRSEVSPVWTVIMHRDSETHELNGYYDFYNTSTGMYLSPQSDGTLVSSTMPGVTLNGRRDGDYVSTVEKWDTDAYQWYGYQVTADENGTFSLSSGTGTESQTFSFASYISESTDELHTVATVDSTTAGVTIKMYDFGTRSDIDAVMGSTSYTHGNPSTGRVSDTLTDGFPVFTSTSQSASNLFGGSNYKGDGNHLFLESVYNSTGYYEYNAFYNFAHYNSDGTFTVYQETGTPSNENQFYYKRGNFFPYNDLDPDRKATNVNLYDGSGEPLDPTDPTNEGTLYMISNPNYYFGMTVEATFMQPRDGYENGTPVIYEFNGDDDLWVYIDGVLILDIGGVHDAIPGSINFATGEIVGQGAGGATTIKDCFKNAGVFPDGTAWDDSRVDEYFKGNTFLDYSSHQFKMFYMEHGAGASNLEVRFNLPVIEKGKFTVEKELDNTSQQRFANVHFAYQAFKRDDSGNDVPLTEAVYEGTDDPVTFYDSVVIGGNTYTNVFYLKPGESATFPEMPEDTPYYVQELGIGSDYYDEVIVNDVQIDGEEVTATDGVYPTTVATVGNRARVTYTNHCSEKNRNALRITKALGSESQDDGSTFEFRVLLENADGALAPYSTGAYSIQDAEGNYYRYVSGQLVSNGKTPITASVAGNNGTIAGIPVGYTVVIDDLLAGTDFYVEEIRLPSGWALDTKTVAADSCDSSTLTGTGFSGNTVTADGQIKLDTDAEETFANKQTLAEISLTKQVTGNMADLTKEFAFTVTAEKGGRGASFDLTADGVTTACESGSGTVRLAHGETAVMTLPVGAVISITEVPDGYTLTSADGATNGSLDADTYTYSFTAVGDDNGKTVTFVNDLSADVDTGVRTDPAPYALILALALPALAVLCGRRRKRA